MRAHSVTRTFCTAFITLTAACADEPGLDVVASAGDLPRCSTFICGNNSPTLGGIRFFELDEKGLEASTDGSFVIAGLFAGDGTELELEVEGAELIGWDPLGVPRKGVLLEGARLVITSLDPTLAGTFFSINFVAAHQLPYWEGGDDGTFTTTFSVNVVEVTGGIASPARQLCAVPANDAMFPASHDVLFFQGDRYSAATGAVVATGAAAGDWFNVTCAGDARAKAHATRHTQASQMVGNPTSAAQRTAALRMFRADYCGTGTPYTELGTPLDWQNAGGWNTFDVPLNLGNIESIWTERGAVCLSNPRLWPLPQALACKIPACDPATVAKHMNKAPFITLKP